MSYHVGGISFIYFRSVVRQKPCINTIRYNPCPTNTPLAVWWETTAQLKKNMPTSLTRGFISNQFHPTPYARLGRQIGPQRRQVRRLVTSRTTKYKSTDTGFSYTSHPALSQSRTSEPESQLTALEDKCTQRVLRNVVQSDNSTVDGHQEAGSHVYSVG